MAVGRALRTARVKAGVSQATLGRRIGFTRSSVSNLEAGRQRIALHLFVLIAEALAVKPAALLPDATLLRPSDLVAQEVLREHLAGQPETTQDFVLSTVAQATDSIRKEA